MLFTVQEAAAALGLPTVSGNTPVTGTSIDTRTLQQGDLFIALSGTPSGGFTSSFASSGDGHNFLKMAEEKGAAAAIVSTPNPNLKIPQLVVKDTLLDGLWTLGRASRQRMRGKLVGLTGSAGKTTTKEMLAALLNSPASVASYNNFWGVPLTLTRIPRTANYAVAEIGMNRPGEISKLSQLAQPDVALIVNVHPVHLEHLGSLAAIAREKLGITEGLKSTGTLVVPQDLDISPSGWTGATLRFGIGSGIYAEKWEVHDDNWLVTFMVEGQRIEALLREGAPHRLHNATAALATAIAAGENPTTAATRLVNAGTMAGRGTVQTVGGITIIDDSFNANPASMTAALQSVAGRPTQGRKFALLGDMLELGNEAPRYHRELLPHTTKLDGIFAIGPLIKNLYETLPANQQFGWCESPEELNLSAILSTLQPGDTLLMKGSKKMLHVPGIPAKLTAALSKTAE
ncbi:MAG: UDP-N-acetylmuramoylalanyl-D-glutamyl-2, 6-diaminopimelate--D-alanyl-D-alanine ligase [Pseudomonas fluorescens]|nr:MAG: UDP-N-acetylmuramoylalanyl-D-glutamyl-2, 6-diaminopimelate--D-alanyl-D-alanine ligase [Pseudomonas fluorescens]